MLGNLLRIAAVALTVYAFFDVIKSRRDWATKVVLFVLILVPFIGPGLYLLVFRDKRAF